MRHSRETLMRVSAACHQAALDGKLRHRPAIDPEDDPHFQAAIRKFRADQAAKAADDETEPETKAE